MTKRPTVLLVIALLLAASSGALAEPLVPEKRYRGESAVEVPALQLGFSVPAGFTGVLPSGSEWFHVGKDDEEGRVFLYADRAPKEQMRALMGAAFPVAGVVTLTPMSAVRDEGGALVADYSASDGRARYAAHVRVLTGKSGVSVAIVAVAPAERIERYKQLGKKLATTLRFDVPTANGSGDEPSGPWAAALANKRVVKFDHGSGYSEKTEFLLCADGRFVRRFGASSLSVNGSGAMHDKNAGRWSVHGDALTLRYHNGDSATVRLEDRGGQLFVDGERWLRESARCR